MLYGASHPDPVSLKVGAIELRRLLNEGAALFDIKIGGDKSVPAILKDRQDHPVRGDVMHVDFLEVNLKEKIHATVALELEGIEDAPGVKEGGVLDLATREINIEALPTDIPDLIVVDVSAMDMGDTLMLESVPVPEGVEFLDDVEETVVATVILPDRRGGARGGRGGDRARRRGRRAGRGRGRRGGDASEESGEDSGDSGDE